MTNKVIKTKIKKFFITLGIIWIMWTSSGAPLNEKPKKIFKESNEKRK